MCQRKGPWVLMVELPAGSFLRLKPFFFFFFQGLFRRLPRGAAVPICRVWGGGRRWPRRDPSTTYVSGPGAAERQLGEGSRKPTETRSPGDPGKASGCNRAAGGNSALFGVKGMYCMYRPGSCAGRGGFGRRGVMICPRARAGGSQLLYIQYSKQAASSVSPLPLDEAFLQTSLCCMAATVADRSDPPSNLHRPSSAPIFCVPQRTLPAAYLA